MILLEHDVRRKPFPLLPGPVARHAGDSNRQRDPIRRQRAAGQDSGTLHLRQDEVVRP